MKKTIAFILTLSMMMGIVPAFGLPLVATVTGDDGTTNWDFIVPVVHQKTVPDGYIGIYTAQDLDNVRNDLSGNYILMNDIDLSTWGNWEPIGNSDGKTAVPFKGTFDGNGYAVSNMTYDKAGDLNTCLGLFGIASGATIKDLGLRKSLISTTASNSSYIGGIVGYMAASSITNCYNTGMIKVDSNVSYAYIGGIVGSCSMSEIISNCFNHANIDINIKGYNSSTISGIGGIIGSSGSIINCYNTGEINIKFTNISTAYSGGVVGLGESLVNCFNIGNINIDSANAHTIGGVAGNGDSLTNCYNAGNISSNAFYSVTGGVIGVLRDSMIGCYNAGVLPGKESYLVGGIIGYSSNYNKSQFVITNCYYSDNALTAFGEDNQKNSINNVVSLTDTQMRLKSAFVGFDFETIWAINPLINKGYPYLQAIPPSMDTFITLSDFTYFGNVGEQTIIGGTFSSEKFEANPSTITWSCSDPTAVTFGQMSVLGTKDNAIISIPVNCNKSGLYTIAVSTTDGASAEAVISIGNINEIQIVNTNPRSGAINFSLNPFKEPNPSTEQPLEIYFDKEIEAGTGNIKICDYYTDEVYLTLDEWNYHVSSEDSKRLEINLPLQVLPLDKKMYVVMPSEVVKPKDDIKTFSGINDKDIWHFTTKWGLDGKKDVFNFYNSRIEEEYAGFTNSKYSVSDSLQSILYYMYPNEYAKLRSKMDDDWKGSCKGMTSVIALNKTGNIDLSAWDSNAKDCFTLSKPKDSMGAYGVQDLINYYQLIQHLKVYTETAGDKNFIRSISDGKFEAAAELIVNSAKNLTFTKTPFLLGFAWKDGAHSCLAYDYEYTERGHEIALYDPSHPFNLLNEKTKMLITTDFKNAKIIEGGSDDYSGVDLLRLTYVTPNDLIKYNIDNLAQHASMTAVAETLDEKTEISCYGEGSFTITNANGKTLSYEQGFFDGDMKVYSDKYIAAGNSPSEIILEVDKSDYFIFTSTTGNYNFSVGQESFYASIRANNANQLKVIPNKEVKLTGENLQYKAYVTLGAGAENDLAKLTGTTESRFTLSYNADNNLAVSADDTEDMEVTLFKDVESEIVNIDDTNEVAEAEGNVDDVVEIYNVSVVGGSDVKTILNYPQQTGAMLIVAVYDDGGKLLSMKQEVVTQSGEITVKDLTIPTTEGTVIKAMLWDGTGTMEPLCESKAKIRHGDDWVLPETSIIISQVLESSHPYDNGLYAGETQIYSYPGICHSIDVTFSEDTKTELDYDFIYILDENDNQIGKFSDTELAGQTINVPGNTIKIKLTSDYSYNDYGYRTTKIVVNI